VTTGPTVATDQPIVAGFRCATCGATVDIATPFTWCCPRAGPGDRHHLLQLVETASPVVPRADPNPFVAFGSHLAWTAFARAHGMTVEACDGLVRMLDASVEAVAGTGFRWTPFARLDALSDELGFDATGGVWVKDETGNVSGSHKARHLFGILLHLRAAEVLGLAPWAGEAERPPLAIASCGNAALAAATLAAAVAWPLEVFVPPWANEHVVGQLRLLRASVTACPRRAGDPPGDPCVHRFREAVAAGAVPFAVQGPENGWCLDGGRTIGWELAVQHEQDRPGEPIDRLFVQVGGGALATCAHQGASAVVGRPQPRLHAVQAEGCAPLDRAWSRLGGSGGARVQAVAERWSELMWPWEVEPESAATGILDDETYDWVGIVEGMVSSGGSPVVASEAQIVAAHRLAHRTTSTDVDPTGTAGLAGLLALRDEIADTERVAVLFTGATRH
jgi:threonine dehydratase